MQLELQALRMRLLDFLVYDCMMPALYSGLKCSSTAFSVTTDQPPILLQPKNALLCVYKNAPILSQAIQPNPTP
jgi:hypothetical protein